MSSHSRNKSPPAIEEELLSPLQTSNRRYESDPEHSKLWGSKRLVVIIFIFLGFIYQIMLKSNLSIAVVEMTSNKTVVMGKKTVIQGPEFSWDSKTKGWILSLFFYGYLFSAVGGYLATKIGGGTVYGLGIMVTAVLTIISPFALRTNLYLFMVGRIIEGLFESFSYASANHLWSRWIPKHELPLMVAFSQSGMHFGASITLPLCGYIAHHWGWPMIFYFSGTFAFIWCLAYFITVKNDPSSHRNISQSELQYIKHNVGHRDTTVNITYPWKGIFASKPMWALCVGKLTYSWSQSFMVTCMPLYVKDITGKTTAEVGFFSGIPSYANMTISPAVGLLIHCLQNKFGIAPTKVHKWTISIGFLVGGVLFMLICFTNFEGSLICFVLITISISSSIVVMQLIIIHMAPDHAGVVAGISAFWYTVSALINPLVIGYIVTDHTWKQWSWCFIINGIILIIGALITIIFGSSEDQNWSSTEYRVPKTIPTEIAYPIITGRQNRKKMLVT